MQNSMFIGLDVHKATISVAIAQGSAAARCAIGDDPASSRSDPQAGREAGPTDRGCISAMRRALAAMACIAARRDGA
jgi:hypothetical protein